MKLTSEGPLRSKGPCGGFSQLTSLLNLGLSLSAEEEQGTGSRKTLWSLTDYAGQP